VAVEAKQLACELPPTSVPLSRWSCVELAQELVGRGVVAAISAATCGAPRLRRRPPLVPPFLGRSSGPAVLGQGGDCPGPVCRRGCTKAGHSARMSSSSARTRRPPSNDRSCCLEPPDLPRVTGHQGATSAPGLRPGQMAPSGQRGQRSFPDLEASASGRVVKPRLTSTATPDRCRSSRRPGPGRPGE
jgi:hypothetical protein